MPSRPSSHSLSTAMRLILAAFATLLLFAAALPIVRRLQADLLAANNPTPEALAAAARLDPLNDIYPILLAQAFQDRDQDPRPAWRAAITINPRRPLSLTQAAIANELAGDPRAAEQLLLQAARFNQLWLPRWSLANFYARTSNPSKTLRWAQLAFERSYGDRTALFRLCLNAGASPEDILDHVLPRSPANLAGFTHFFAADPASPPQTLHRAASLHLASHSPHPLPATLHAINALIAARQPALALDLWSQLSALQLLPYPPRTPSAPLVNPAFLLPLEGRGFDWSVPQIPGVESTPGVPTRGIKFLFSGIQPESTTLLQQTLVLEGARDWTLAFSCQTIQIESAANGLSWSLTPLGSNEPLPSSSAPNLTADDWTPYSITWQLPPGQSLYVLSLDLRRLSGHTRIEGEARFRDLQLREARP
ncbi:MAG: hypothetical protein HY821_05900 [Acidobacteria bacterium]|nr:hypothetical protein [Acidobacteriota bacterium]